MSAEKQAILDKYIKLFHEYHDCLHCLNVGCNDRGKNDRRCCFQGNNLCVSWIENLAQEISALYIKETGQQATNSDLMKLLCDIKTLLLDVDTPTRKQRSDIVHRIANVSVAQLQ